MVCHRFFLIAILLTICSGTLPAQFSSTKEDEERFESGIDFQMQRQQFFLKQRLDENGVIPFNALIRAKEQMTRMKKTQTQLTPMDGGIWNWEWLGPGNIGGRVRAILIHPTNPNTMWVGSVSGGIWKTDNGGASWYVLDDFMANLAVTSLVMDPTNSNIIYASTGEAFGNFDGVPGAGIFKSTDGGTTWSQLTSTANADYTWVGRLAHHPSRSNELLAATVNSAGNGTLRKSTDGGTTWTALFTIGTQRMCDVKYHPINPNRILVGAQFDAYYSADSGATWDRITDGGVNKLIVSPGRCEVAFAPSNNYMYLSVDINQGEIWRSTDGGATWSQRINGRTPLEGQGFYYNAIWVSPTDPNFILVGGIGFWKSADGGATMTYMRVRHADQHAIVSHPGYNGTTNRIIILGNDGGVEKTTDIISADSVNQSYWASLNNNLGITQFVGGAAADDGSLIAGGAQDNDKLHFRPANGPQNWTYANNPGGNWGDGGHPVINKSNPSKVYGQYIVMDIKRSDDGGLNYAQKTNGLGDFGNINLTLFYSPLAIDPNNYSTLVTGGSRIWRTTNNADNWSQFRAADPGGRLCSAIDIAKGNSNVIWVGYSNGAVARTTDGGAIWTNVQSNSTQLPNLYVTDIAINPLNSSEVFVTVGGYSVNTVWYTSNSGANWERRTGTAPTQLPAVQVNSITFHPLQQNWVYVGTDLGVFASEDKGLTWKLTPRYGTTEGPANVRVTDLIWQGNDNLIAVTYGRGMYRCRTLQTVYIDQANISGLEDGSSAYPYSTFWTGYSVAGHGTAISIRTGTYTGAPAMISKRGTINATGGLVEIRP